MNKCKYFLLPLLILICSCCRVPNKIEPKICYQIEDKKIRSLPAAFAPLSTEEKRQDWGKEYLIGISFAKRLDLYQAITSFKRAEILIPPSYGERLAEIQYNILLCYYFGKKYTDVIDTFENSTLPSIDKKFSSFHDLLVVLYESYKELQEEEKAQRILDVIDKNYPATKEQLDLAISMMDADFCELNKIMNTPPKNKALERMLNCYHMEKKSIAKAQLYNALLPGAGYLYLGMGKTALTAFLLNGLFIAASYKFFERGYIAAGLITTSFVLGWYFGGIYGAGEEAKFYNERIYDCHVSKFMQEKKLFPIFMIKWGF